MGTNTITKLQVYDVVPVSLPNEGKPSYRDASYQEIRDQALNASLKRIDTIITVTSSVFIAPDTKIAKVIKIYMDASISDFNTNGLGNIDGEATIFEFTQDATGGRTVNWNVTKFNGGQDQGLPILWGTPNSTDWVLCLWNASQNKQNIISHVRNYV